MKPPCSSWPNNAGSTPRRTLRQRRPWFQRTPPQAPDRRIEDRVGQVRPGEQQQPPGRNGFVVDRRADPAGEGQVQQHRGGEHPFAAVAVERGATGRVVQQQQKEVFGDLRHERWLRVVRLRADQRHLRRCCRWAACTCGYRRPWRRSARRPAESSASTPRACRRSTPSWRVAIRNVSVSVSSPS